MRTLHLLIAFAAFIPSVSAMDFTDVPNAAWYAPYVRAASESGIISGYADRDGKLTGTYGPSDPVTLAEALKISVLGAGYAPDGYAKKCPEGVIDERWFSPYICVDIEEGIMPFVGEFYECYEGCTIQAQRERWDVPAKRHEVAHMVAEAFRLPINDSLDGFSYRDIDIHQNVNQERIEALTSAAIVTGDVDASGEPKGTFRPNDPINRAEMAKMIMVARQLRGEPGNNRTWMDGRIETDKPIVEVTYKNSTFTPSRATIPKGGVISFCNEGKEGLIVVSSDYPEFLRKLRDSACPEYKLTVTGTYHFENSLSDLHPGKTIEVTVES